MYGVLRLPASTDSCFSSLPSNITKCACISASTTSQHQVPALQTPHLMNTVLLSGVTLGIWKHHQLKSLNTSMVKPVETMKGDSPNRHPTNMDEKKSCFPQKISLHFGLSKKSWANSHLSECCVMLLVDSLLNQLNIALNQEQKPTWKPTPNPVTSPQRVVFGTMNLWHP